MGNMFKELQWLLETMGSTKPSKNNLCFFLYVHTDDKDLIYKLGTTRD